MLTNKEMANNVAEVQGKSACAFDATIADNPYKPGSEQYFAWEIGFITAFQKSMRDYLMLTTALYSIQ